MFTVIAADTDHVASNLSGENPLIDSVAESVRCSEYAFFGEKFHVVNGFDALLAIRVTGHKSPANS